MTMSSKRLQSCILGALLCGLASCGVPTKRFYIDAIDFEDRKIKCLVVLDSDWPGDDGKKVVYTPAHIDVPFGSKVVYVQVKPATLGPDGEVIGIPRESDPAEYKTRGRDIQIDYPSQLTFILERQ